ncbi:hypothetical protein [Streptomyces olivaceoviridis]|uniref:hypothetical protein n=1 Tax=Streptomyces olivaceoviridis TaxID=1921 RepID=UPI001676A593|nr:hypothetical protein [Streptomyces olivaceoviridis]
MNFWDESGRELHNAVLPESAVQAAWDQLNAAEARGVAAACAARLSKGDLILRLVRPASDSAEIRRVLGEFAQTRGISFDTVDQYRRVAAWYTPARRAAMEETGGTASYTVLREVALQTFGEADPHARFDALLAALRETAACGGAPLTGPAYRERLGVSVVRQTSSSSPPTGATARADTQLVASVLQAVAEDPQGPAQFFDVLAAEGGLDALESASLMLRRAKAGARAEEERVFGKEEPSSLEVTLRLVLRTMRALEKSMDLDPVQVVAVLPPEQFAALNRMCGSVTQWHELLLAAARAVQPGKEVA